MEEAQPEEPEEVDSTRKPKPKLRSIGRKVLLAKKLAGPGPLNAWNEGSDSDVDSAEGENEEQAAARALLDEEFLQQQGQRESRGSRRVGLRNGSHAFRETLLMRHVHTVGGEEGQTALNDRTYKRYNVIEKELNPDGTTQVEKRAVHGVLIDFMMRMNPGKKSKSWEPEKCHPHEHVARLTGSPTKDDGAQWQSYLGAIEAVNSEMLYSELFKVVTGFHKEQKTTGWAVTGTELKDVVRRVYEIKKRVACVRAEVGNWMMRQKLLRAKPNDYEMQKERHERHQEFWAQFHEIPRKMEVKQRPLCGKDAETRAALTPAALQHGKALEIKNRPCHDRHWKARPARSRCSAGAWDWSRGASRPSTREAERPVSQGSGMWRYDDAPALPTPATPAAKAPKYRWWESHNPAMETESPFILARQSIGPTDVGQGAPTLATVASANLTKQTSNMTKTKSLPSLPGRQAPQKGMEFTGRFVSNALVDHFPAPEKGLEIPVLSRSMSRPGSREKPLPPIEHAGAFIFPWQGKSPVPTLKCEETATTRYLCSVQERGCLPKPWSFTTGHSLKFAVGHGDSQSIFDSDLLSVVDMMATIEIQEIDLEGNLLLTEKALVKFAKTLADNPAAQSLQRLNLKRCINSGQLVTDIIIKMIADTSAGCYNLKSLDLSGIPIGTRRFLPLCKAMGKHPMLETLMFADTGLGASADPAQCIDNILGSETITTLDIGWNCFSEEVFDHLGERLVDKNVVKKLMIPSCSSGGKVGFASPIVFFIEHLSRCRTLRILDISLNKIDFRGALVIEDALEHRKSLTELDISHNPLGFLGMRNMLRLLVRDTSGLVFFKCDECSSGKTMDASEIYQVFTCNSPGGLYRLELTRPYHRSILRMLYKTCERFCIDPGSAFTDLKGTPAYNHASKGECGLWVVPKKGKIDKVTFTIDKAVEDSLHSTKGFSQWDFASFLERYYAMMKVTPAFHKIIPLLAQWKSLEGRSNEQRCLLCALSKDFLITYPQFDLMAQSRSMLSEIIAALLPCISGGQVTRCLTMMHIPSLGEFVNVMTKQRNLLNCNIDNPNGHYKLDLENPSDHAVADRLLLLDRWETSIAKRLGRMDCSQRGNHSCIRNEMYQHRPLRVASLQEWNMPEVDQLEFDYSSGKRPPPDAVPISETAFLKLLVALQNSDCKAGHQIGAMRNTSHMMYVKSMQMRGFLGIYADAIPRAEIFVLFFLRVVDFFNEKIYRVRFDDEAELAALSDRLGWVTLFPFIQPEQATFKLDFANYDQRLAANLVVALACKETMGNLRDPRFVLPGGAVDPLALGIPRSWEYFDKMPKGGHLTVTYVCSPEDRSYATRRKCYEMYGYREGVPEDQVMWWAAINAAPEDVIEYLSWLVAKFDSVEGAFYIIDGEGGNGVISLREFEEAYGEMGCHKFEGPQEQEHIRGLFRYLDPSGEGSISLPEWNVLELLWKEIKLSITEFVQFCERTFGDDLEAAWQFMDSDGGGEIDFEEWCDACAQVGYFGPVVPIFGFLDADDEGTVSIDEFKLLETFQEPPEKRFNYMMEHLRST